MAESVKTIRELSDSALLERIRAGVDAAKNWDEAVFRGFSRRDFDAALADWPAAQAFAVAVEELTGRAESLDHETREGILAAIHPIPEQLKAAKPFFVRFAPEIDRIRELEIFWKKSEAVRQRDKAFGVARITVTCFEKDVARIREFVQKVNAESKFDQVVPKKMAGRPPKPGSAAAKRRQEIEMLFGKRAIGAGAGVGGEIEDETVEPTAEDLAKATKPFCD